MKKHNKVTKIVTMEYIGWIGRLVMIHFREKLNDKQIEQIVTKTAVNQ